MARENYLSPLDSLSPDEFYESYEDLFEDDDSTWGPCYLPDKNQDSKKDSEIGQEIGETTDVVINSDESRDTIIEGCCLGGGEIENKSEFNEGGIGQSSALKEGQIEENSLLNEGQTDENCNLNGGQIEGNSYPHEGHIEENCSSDNGEYRGISAIHEGDFEEKSTLLLGEIIIKEDGISEAENVLGSSSGGYEAGTSTSVSASSSLSSAIEDGNIGQSDDGSSGADWNGRDHENEDDTSITWRKRKKHFFILSHSGKPIYSRYGDETKLAGFSATLQAIISFVENTGDNIKLVRAGNHQIVFLVKGPVYLVSISSTKESFQALRIQLELLYGQMLLILTRSIEKYFQKNAKFDMRPLLGGTDVVFSSLIHAFSWNPATFLHAYTCVPLSYATRQAAGGVLQDIVDSRVLFAILMCRHKVISIAGAQKATLHPDDILLLSNFVLSTESFRTSESFSPICLPRYNPAAFLHAYVQFFKDDIFLVVLTTDSNGFYHLRDCRIQIESVLNKSNVLNEVKGSMLSAGLHVEDLPSDSTNQSRCDDGHSIAVSVKTERHTMGVGGPSGLWHFMYKSIYLDQFVASEYSPSLTGRRAQKRLLRAYENLYTSMHGSTLGPQKMQYRRDENYILLCWITPDFELYAAFDPLAEKSVAITTCNRVCQWLRDLENEIFLIGASPFSW